MLKNKQGEFGLVAALALLFSAIVFVSAQVLNSTDNSGVNITLNDTLLNISLINQLINLSISNNSIVENATLINKTTNLTIPAGNISNQSITINETINLTVPIENLTLNQSINLTSPIGNLTLTNLSFVKNLSEIVEKNKHKLNAETESYLKGIKDKNEVKGYIVKFRNSIDENKLVNVTLEKKIDKFKVTKIKGEVEDIEDLIEDNEIEFLELDQNVKVLEENIPFNIKKVKADSVWNLSNGSGVKVAVLDTGIGSHDDLSIAGGVSLVDNNYFDSNGHGTAVAGVIAALLNNEGLVGISPDVSLYSVKIMQSSTGDLSNAIAGIEWAINNSMNIASMSFGFNSYSQIFKEVLQDAYNNNILLVAASGNEGTDNILYPAKYSTVIAVGAINIDDNLASFSSYGFEQELVAPGIDINSTSLGNSYSISSGTSLAAPHVAGVAALIKSFNKSLTNEQIRAKLRNDALDLGQDGKDDLYGYGLVQVNLLTTNYILINLSYFYEVFNISDFGLPNITFTFWLNGTGTIDDVNFSQGYYLVNITFNDYSKRSSYYYVDENGTLISLLITMGFNDNYVGEGSTTDDTVVWVNGNMKFNISTINSERDAECFDTDFNGTPNACYYKTGMFTVCDEYSTTASNPGDEKARFHDVCVNPALTCAEGIPHNEPLSTSSRGDKRAEVTQYIDCDNSASQQDFESTNNPHYFVIDAKRAICDGTVNYHYGGRYGSNAGDWRTYKTASCSTTCDSNLDDQIVTSESGTVPSPCTPESTPASICNGTIATIVTDSKSNPLNGLKVFSNSILNGTTDLDGSRLINVTNIECGNVQNITIKCGDDTVCDSKSTSIDSSNDYDSLTFSCNICVNKTDLSIKTSDVTIKSTATNKHNITALINVEKVSANDVVIDFRGQNLKNDITQNETKTINIAQYTNQNVSVLWDLNSTDFVSITVDFKNTIAETDESNNYIRKAARPATKAYVEVSTDYPVLTSVINNYLDDYIELVSSGQDVNIYVGRKNVNIPKELQTLSTKQTWKLENNIVSFNSKSEGLPYNGIAVKSGTNIYVFGNEIDGDIAALRKIVDNQEFYFSKSVNERIDYISEEDLDGLFVFDYLHTDEKQPDYRKNNNNFAKGVENVLNSDVSTLAIKRVLTTNDNTSLRIKHINAELGPKFREFANPQPVVLARGLWSNLFTWERFGREIAEGVGNGKPRDIWLIEITGGPNTECSTCPNYNFSELTEFYWPALISGIQAYSNKTNITYIGFSNGCRVALRSLEKYQNTGKSNAGYYNNGSDWILTNLTAKPKVVDTFVAVGCPGTFLGNSPFAQVIRDHGNHVANYLSSRSHVNATDVGRALLQQCGRYSEIFDPIKIRACRRIGELLTGESKISYNLANEYNNWIRNGNGSQVGTGINVNNFLLIYGTLPWYINLVGTSDGIVSVDDSGDIYETVNATNKQIQHYPNVKHASGIEEESLPDRLETRNRIRNFINEVN